MSLEFQAGRGVCKIWEKKVDFPAAQWKKMKNLRKIPVGHVNSAGNPGGPCKKIKKMDILNNLFSEKPNYL